MAFEGVLDSDLGMRGLMLSKLEDNSTVKFSEQFAEADLLT